MPNHCDNKLTLVGPDADVDKWVSVAEKHPSVLSFSEHVPLTEDSVHGEHQAWGVKWGAYGEKLVENSLISGGRRQATYHFQTAWGPPLKFLETTSRKYPHIIFLLSFGEEYPTRGRFIIRAGEVTEIANQDGCPDYGAVESEHYAGDPKLDPEDNEHVITTAYKRWQNEYYDSHESWISDAVFVGQLMDGLAGL